MQVEVEVQRSWPSRELLVSISSSEVQRVEVELGVVDSSSVLSVAVVSVPVVVEEEEGVEVRGVWVSSRLLLVPPLPLLYVPRWTGVSVRHPLHLPLVQQVFVPGLFL